MLERMSANPGLFYKSNGEKLLNGVEPDPNWYRKPYERVYVTTVNKEKNNFHSFSVPLSTPFNSKKLKPNWSLGLNIYRPYEREELDNEQNLSRKLLPIDWTSDTRLMFYEIAIPDSSFHWDEKLQRRLRDRRGSD